MVVPGKFCPEIISAASTFFLFTAKGSTKFFFIKFLHDNNLQKLD